MMTLFADTLMIATRMDQFEKAPGAPKGRRTAGLGRWVRAWVGTARR